MLFEQANQVTEMLPELIQHKTRYCNPATSQQILRLIILSTLLLFCSAARSQENLPARTFGDWVVNCSVQEDGKVGCGMSQVAVYEDTSERLLRVDLRYGPSREEATIQFILPLGVALDFIPQLFIDEKFSAEVRLNHCLPEGCYSTFVLKPQVLEKLLSMKVGNIQIQAANGHMMSLPVSGKGSREAFNAISASATD